MSPPLRDVSNQDYCRYGLQQGPIQTVATGRASFDLVGQKDMGSDNFTLIPNGIPSAEDRGTMLYG